MLAIFATDACANITMFGENALDTLKMMGHSATVSDAIKAEDVPEVLSRLTSATKSGKIPPSTAIKNAVASEVSTEHRGLPLINLLTVLANNGKPQHVG